MANSAKTITIAAEMTCGTKTGKDPHGWHPYINQLGYQQLNKTDMN